MSDKRDVHKAKNRRNNPNAATPRPATDQRVATMSQPASAAGTPGDDTPGESGRGKRNKSRR
jgi:hypothetical protein